MLRKKPAGRWPASNAFNAKQRQPLCHRVHRENAKKFCYAQPSISRPAVPGNELLLFPLPGFLCALSRSSLRTPQGGIEKNPLRQRSYCRPVAGFSRLPAIIIKRARRCDGPLSSVSCRQELRSQPRLPASCRGACAGAGDAASALRHAPRYPGIRQPGCASRSADRGCACRLPRRLRWSTRE